MSGTLVMVNKKSKKGGGSKLNRTQTVTLRLDPRLRYLTDIAARTQRRTTSGFVEWAIEQSLEKVPMSGETGDNLLHASILLWDVVEVDRFVALAVLYPNLLTYEEQVLWKLIKENGYIWRGKYEKPSGEYVWDTKTPDNLIYENLRSYWGKFKAVAADEMDNSQLPKWDKRKPVQME